MYQFKIRKEENGGFRFDLGTIKMLIEDYFVKDDRHFLINPGKAIGYFNGMDNFYSISNGAMNFETAEAFYDAILRQYSQFFEKKD